MMTDQDLRIATIGFRTGYQDAAVGGHFGLWMMHQAPLTDVELSDYWYGWHRGNRHNAEKNGPRLRMVRRRA